MTASHSTPSAANAASEPFEAESGDASLIGRLLSRLDRIDGRLEEDAWLIETLSEKIDAVAARGGPSGAEANPTAEAEARRAAARGVAEALSARTDEILDALRRQGAALRKDQQEAASGQARLLGQLIERTQALAAETLSAAASDEDPERGAARVDVDAISATLTERLSKVLGGRLEIAVARAAASPSGMSAPSFDAGALSAITSRIDALGAAIDAASVEARRTPAAIDPDLLTRSVDRAVAEALEKRLAPLLAESLPEALAVTIETSVEESFGPPAPSLPSNGPTPVMDHALHARLDRLTERVDAMAAELSRDVNRGADAALAGLERMGVDRDAAETRAAALEAQERRFAATSARINAAADRLHGALDAALLDERSSRSEPGAAETLPAELRTALSALPDRAAALETQERRFDAMSATLKALAERAHQAFDAGLAAPSSAASGPDSETLRGLGAEIDALSAKINARADALESQERRLAGATVAVNALAERVSRAFEAALIQDGGSATAHGLSDAQIETLSDKIEARADALEAQERRLAATTAAVKALAERLHGAADGGAPLDREALETLRAAFEEQSRKSAARAAALDVQTRRLETMMVAMKSIGAQIQGAGAEASEQTAEQHGAAAPLETRLAALQETMQATLQETVQETVSELPSALERAQRVGLDRLEARIERVAAMAAPSLSDLERRMADLAQALSETLSSRADAAWSGALEMMAARLEARLAAPAPDADPILETSPEISADAPADARLDALEAALSERFAALAEDVRRAVAPSEGARPAVDDAEILPDDAPDGAWDEAIDAPSARGLTVSPFALSPADPTTADAAATALRLSAGFRALFSKLSATADDLDGAVARLRRDADGLEARDAALAEGLAEVARTVSSLSPEAATSATTADGETRDAASAVASLTAHVVELTEAFLEEAEAARDPAAAQAALEGARDEFLEIAAAATRALETADRAAPRAAD